MSYELQATIREAQGTGASRRLRRAGQVPAVLYGDNQEAVAIAVDHKTVFYALEKSAFHTSLIKLTLDGKTQDVIVRDFQIHPFRQQVVHLDFQAVDLNKPLRLRLPATFCTSPTSNIPKASAASPSNAAPIWPLPPLPVKKADTAG